MIELEVNGNRQAVQPTSGGDLYQMLERELPSGHVIRRIDVDGAAIDAAKLDQIAVEHMRSVVVESCTAAQIAQDSVAETSEWIGRICGVLDQIASEFRLGNASNATERLVEVVDALQVLVGLLSGINEFLEVDPQRHAAFKQEWGDAEAELCGSIEGLFAELQSGDPVALADRTGHSLPRALDRFRKLLEQV